MKPVEMERAFNYALRFSLSVYDASFLALAKELKFPLLSIDKDLSKKGKSIIKIVSLSSKDRV